jgi:hypothetical protein
MNDLLALLIDMVSVDVACVPGELTALAALAAAA